jgi:uncharacterized protein with FMN-binding domain
MRRVALAIVSTVTGLVLLLGFKTHAPSTPAAPAAAVSTPTGTSGSGTGTTGTGNGTTKKKAPSTKAPSANRTATGAPVMTRYGPVQVKVTVTGSKVTGVTAVDYPMGNPRDAQINAYAIPALNQEAAAAGSANISMISGATFTSQGYIASLQSALDQLGV